MQCQKCGYMMTAFEKTCPRCPTIQSQQFPVPAVPALPQPPNQYAQGYPQPVVILQQPNPQTSHRKKAWVVFGITFAGFGMAFAILIFVFFLCLLMIIMSSCSSAISKSAPKTANNPPATRQTAALPRLPESSFSTTMETTPAPVPDASAHRAQFVATLQEVEGISRWIKQTGRGLNEDDLLVVVGSDWHYEPRQMRLQMAQAMWKIWAGIHSPNEPDKARISLKDMMGNRIGGSSWMGGSVVHVDD